MLVAVATANSRTTTGTQDFTVTGFGTPKAALFFWTLSQPLGTRVSENRVAFGATDGTRQWVAAASSQTATNPIQTSRYFNTDRLLTFVTPGTEALVAEADFDSWITDGVRLNWVSVSATARPIGVILFGGADLTAYCGTQSLGTGTSAINVTTLGAAAKLVYAACCGMPIGSAAATALLSVGAGIPGGNQRAWAYGASDNVSPTVVNSKLYTNAIAAQVNADAEAWRASLGSHASGFTLTPSANAGSDDVGYLALDFTGNVAVDTLTLPTSGGSPWAETWPGWTPQAVLLAPTMHTAVDTLETGAKAGALGFAASDGATELAFCLSDQDNQATSDVSNITDDKALLLDDDDGTTAFDGSGLTFTGTGFSVGTVATAQGTQRYGWGVAFEEESTAGPALVTASINAAGDELSLEFDESTDVGSGGSGGVTLSCSTGAVTVTYDSGSGSDTLIYTLSRTVYDNEVLTVSYVQPGDGLEATDDSADVEDFTSQGVTNGSTQDSLSGNTSPIAANTRTLTLTSLLPTPSWSSDDTDVMTVSGGVVTLAQASGGVAVISDGCNTETVEFLPRVPTWSYGAAAGTIGLAEDITVAVTLTGYGDGASVGTYPDVAPSCIAGDGVTFDGFTGTEPNYTATFTTTTGSGPYTAFLNGVERDITPYPVLIADPGSYAITGTDASLEVGRKLSCDSGTYTITGTAASLEAGYKVACDAGSYTVAGTAASLEKGYKLACDAGSYAVTGTAANLEWGHNLSLDSGTYTITGTDAALVKSGNAVLACESGTYTLSGTDASLEFGRRLAADAGSYAVSGTAATLRGTFIIRCDVGSYLLAGTNVTLNWSGAVGPGSLVGVWSNVINCRSDNQRIECVSSNKRIDT